MPEQTILQVLDVLFAVAAPVIMLAVASMMGIHLLRAVTKLFLWEPPDEDEDLLRRRRNRMHQALTPPQYPDQPADEKELRTIKLTGAAKAAYQDGMKRCASCGSREPFDAKWCTQCGANIVN